MCKLRWKDVPFGLEDVLKSVISYWVWLKEQEKIMEYPSAVLIRALGEQWEPEEESILNSPTVKKNMKF
ncbi:MAG: hypothetical protein RLZZ507_3882 [Cyanobacteriota bacterium]|jgi:hypothetical protein